MLLTLLAAPAAGAPSDFGAALAAVARDVWPRQSLELGPQQVHEGGFVTYHARLPDAGRGPGDRLALTVGPPLPRSSAARPGVPLASAAGVAHVPSRAVRVYVADVPDAFVLPYSGPSRFGDRWFVTHRVTLPCGPQRLQFWRRASLDAAPAAASPDAGGPLHAQGRSIWQARLPETAALAGRLVDGLRARGVCAAESGNDGGRPGDVLTAVDDRGERRRDRRSDPDPGTPYRQPPPPGARDAAAPSADVGEILSGLWGDGNGKTYDARRGDFYRRNGYLSLRLSCAQDLGKKTVSPVYRCSGDWFDSKGEDQGDYRAKLYFLRGEKWHLEGTYNSASAREDWYEWSLSKVQDPGPAVIAAPPAAPAGPSAVSVSEILSGRWGDENGKTYELRNGDFFRLDSNIPHMRLSCTQNLERRTVSPIYDCTGDWFDLSGEDQGDYRGQLYFLRGEKWHLEGRYNSKSKPEDWYGHSYSKFPGTTVAAASAESILSGRWGDGNGGTYDVRSGKFYRLDGSLSLSLGCTQNFDKETVSPVFDCRGDWYNGQGEDEGDYRGKLYFLRGEKWYLEGTYNNRAQPADWYEWSLARFPQ